MGIRRYAQTSGQSSPLLATSGNPSNHGAGENVNLMEIVVRTCQVGLPAIPSDEINVTELAARGEWTVRAAYIALSAMP